MIRCRSLHLTLSHLISVIVPLKSTRGSFMVTTLIIALPYRTFLQITLKQEEKVQERTQSFHLSLCQYFFRFGVV